MLEKQYKVVFFDWNKTLSNSLFWSQLSDSQHPRNGWHKKIVDFVFIKNKSLIDRWMRSEIDKDYITQLIADEYGYSKSDVMSDLAESCEKMKFVDEQVLDLINQIRKNGVECVIATDNMDTFMEYTKPALELDTYFDDFLVSFDKKVLKFDIENENSIPFFDSYLKEKKLSYKDVLLIDDCIDDGGTYEKLGFDILQISSSDDFLKKLKKLQKQLA
jgi:FMN phosphatase YigB (HAD superfamily)